MLRNTDALEALRAQIDMPEKGRSSYWDAEYQSFTVNADWSLIGNNVLGNYSKNRGVCRNLFHWSLQLPFRFMVTPFYRVWQLENIGRKIAKLQGRLFTHDMIRQILTLALIDKYSHQNKIPATVLNIGDGYGFMSSLFLSTYLDRKVICVNLTKPLLLDAIFVRKGVPGVNTALVTNLIDLKNAIADPAINLVLVQADNANILTEIPIGLATNLVSMQEMDMPVVKNYFDILRRNPANHTLFYCCNKLMKELPDGSKIRFDQYPWKPNDLVFYDSICPWSQWYYSKKPPFWHYRVGEDRVIWHRLVSLDKT